MPASAWISFKDACTVKPRFKPVSPQLYFEFFCTAEPEKSGKFKIKLWRNWFEFGSYRVSIFTLIWYSLKKIIVKNIKLISGLHDFKISMLIGIWKSIEFHLPHQQIPQPLPNFCIPCKLEAELVAIAGLEETAADFLEIFVDKFDKLLSLTGICCLISWFLSIRRRNRSLVWYMNWPTGGALYPQMVFCLHFRPCWWPWKRPQDWKYNIRWLMSVCQLVVKF